jgi:hypothetical protein
MAGSRGAGPERRPSGRPGERPQGFGASAGVSRATRSGGNAWRTRAGVRARRWGRWGRSRGRRRSSMARRARRSWVSASSTSQVPRSACSGWRTRGVVRVRVRLQTRSVCSRSKRWTYARQRTASGPPGPACRGRATPASAAWGCGSGAAAARPRPTRACRARPAWAGGCRGRDGSGAWRARRPRPAPAPPPTGHAPRGAPPSAPTRWPGRRRRAAAFRPWRRGRPVSGCRSGPASKRRPLRRRRRTATRSPS